jgi:FtsP/CotA-like multicopper oxidase with cupredoxin domain
MLMTEFVVSHRRFLGTTGALAGASLLRSPNELFSQSSLLEKNSTKANYELIIATTPLVLSPSRIVSSTTYNGQFPGPLLRLKEGQRVTVDVHNETDVPER